jgi:hypothetical protein
VQKVLSRLIELVRKISDYLETEETAPAGSERKTKGFALEEKK